jgi:hypothetical protein
MENMGRDELDSLVAEKVMGWFSHPYDYPHGMTWFDVSGKDTGRYLTEFGSQECNPFSPSTDIAAAWEVLTAFTQNIREAMARAEKARDTGTATKLMRTYMDLQREIRKRTGLYWEAL